MAYYASAPRNLRKQKGGGAMNTEGMTDEMKALRQLLGDAPVVTPDSLTVGLGWLLATIKAETMRGGAGEARQEWATATQVASVYGVKRSQAVDWLNRLAAQGKVRRWQSEAVNGSKGHMRYNLDDIAAAWAVERG